MQNQSIYNLLSTEVKNVLRANPEGLLQSQIAAKLGIPRQKDNNWITYYILRSLIQDGFVIKNERKVFSLV
jgi:predicted transcriptional regulator